MVAALKSKIMTAKEKEAFNQMQETITGLRSAVDFFIENQKQETEKIQKKLEEKYVPVNFEHKILSVLSSSLDKSIKENLTRYNNPLQTLVTSVVESRSESIKEIISSSFDHVIEKDEFKASIISAFSHKVSRSIISNNDGLFDKVSNELKQDSKFKAKMTLAVAKVVEECLKGGE